MENAHSYSAFLFLDQFRHSILCSGLEYPDYPSAGGEVLSSVLCFQVDDLRDVVTSEKPQGFCFNKTVM